MNNKFSQNLKKIRKDNNMSQEQLAEELGVSRQAISKWESAISYPEMDKIITLCDKFNLKIDDLLHGDIREIKEEEELKKNLNGYIDDFLNFITNTINMFSNMSLKSKIKCLVEQIIVSFLLFLFFLIIGFVGRDLIWGVLGEINDKVYFIIISIIRLIYVVFSFSCSIMIILHVFKTRYLDYYEKIDKCMFGGDFNSEIILVNNNDVELKDKSLFDKNKNRIIIRDPEHSEYRFINGILKVIIGFIKFLVLCFLFLLFLILVFFVFMFIISFLLYKTGMFFIGLLILFLSLGVIDVDFILVGLNFVFNRKNNKRVMIWSFIISFIFLGVGIGFISIGLLKFEYVSVANDFLKTDYIEFDMKDDFFVDTYIDVEYVEENIENVRVEYKINKYCDVNYSNLSHDKSSVYIWGYCSSPIKLINVMIDYINDKKIVFVNDEFVMVKVYASRSNIDKMIFNKNKEFYYGIR